jgi:hypothetical protein
MNVDSWALKTTHIAKPTTFHHIYARWLVKGSRWDGRFHIIMKAILKHLELPTMEQIISKRSLLCREADLLERSSVYKLNPWVNPNEGRKRRLRGIAVGNVISFCFKV